MNKKRLGIMLVGLLTCISAYPMANDGASEETIDTTIETQHWSSKRKKLYGALTAAGIAGSFAYKFWSGDPIIDHDFFLLNLMLHLPATYTLHSGLPRNSFEELYSKAHRQYDPAFEFGALKKCLDGIHNFESDIEKYNLTEAQRQQLQDLEDHVTKRMHSH